MYVCLSIYMYMYVCIYLYICKYMFMFTQIYVYVYIYSFICVCVGEGVGVGVGLYIYTSALCVSSCIYFSMYIYLSTNKCKYISLSIYKIMYLQFKCNKKLHPIPKNVLYLYTAAALIKANLYMYMYICVHTCIYVAQVIEQVQLQWRNSYDILVSTLIPIVRSVGTRVGVVVVKEQLRHSCEYTYTHSPH